MALDILVVERGQPPGWSVEIRDVTPRGIGYRMGLVKGELEDLAFMHIEPEAYARTAREVERQMKVSQSMIEKVRARLQAKLAETAIPGEVLAATDPRTTSRRSDWGWQLGPLFDFVEPLPL